MAIHITPKKKRTNAFFLALVVAILVSSSLYLDVGILSTNSSQQEQSTPGIQNQPAPQQAQSSVNGSYTGYVEWTLLLNNTLINGNYQGNVGTTGSGPLLYDPLNGFIYLSDLLTGNVTVVNTHTNRVVLNISGLSYPESFALDTSDNFLYVANGGSISVINASSNRFVGNITVGTLMGGIALDPSDHYLYVTEYGVGSVLAIDTKTGSIVANISVGDDPSAISYDPSDGYVYVAHSLPIIIAGPTARYETHSNAVSLGYNNSSNLVIINSLTNSIIQNVSVGSYISSIACSPTTGMVYVADAFGYIVALDPTNDSVASNISVGDNPDSISFDPSSGYVYVTSFPSIGGISMNNSTIRNMYRNGSYVFVLNASSGQVVSRIPTGMAPIGIAYVPAKESFYVSDGYDGSISIISTQPGYTVNFRESGLPSGTHWSATLDGSRIASNNSTIVYKVSNGTYPYTIEPLKGFSSNPSSGALAVNGSSVDVPIAFSNSSFTVTFKQTGLPRGGMPHNQWLWSVNLSNGQSIQNAGGSYSGVHYWNWTQFGELNGSYSFSIGTVNAYTPYPSSGNFTVNGSSINISVTFNPPPGYQVNFTEVGIPTEGIVYWQVTVDNLTMSPGTNFTHLTFYLPRGNYTYRATTYFGSIQYTAFPSVANFSVNGNEDVLLHFKPYWSVTFRESGLPAGYKWNAALNYVSQENESGKIVFKEYSQYNGSYNFSVFAEEYLGIETGTATSHVTGEPYNITIYYDFMRAYKLTVVENGLPSGTTWSITLYNIRETFSNSTTILPANFTANSSNNTMFIDVTNGSFSYEFGRMAGFNASQYSGKIAVNGNSVRLEVNWTIMTYPVKITLSGIQSGVVWSVTVLGTTFDGQQVNETSISSTVTINFDLPNGTYHIDVNLPSGYQRNGHLGEVSGFTVAGSSFTVQVAVIHTIDYLQYAIIVTVAIIVVLGIAVSLIVRNRKK